MTTNSTLYISQKLNLSDKKVNSTLKLLDSGATVPFIARYRKEATGALDETEILQIKTLNEQLLELNKRRETIMKSLVERDLLTTDLEQKLRAAEALNELEDIYLPYKPKKRTRAIIAAEKGLKTFS